MYKYLISFQVHAIPILKIVMEIVVWTTSIGDVAHLTARLDGIVVKKISKHTQTMVKLHGYVQNVDVEGMKRMNKVF